MGASGDLAPLSHLALGMMGEGKMWSKASGWGDSKYVSGQLFYLDKRDNWKGFKNLSRCRGY